MEYFGFFESLRNWAKMGAALPAPLLKKLWMSESVARYSYEIKVSQRIELTRKVQ